MSTNAESGNMLQTCQAMIGRTYLGPLKDAVLFAGATQIWEPPIFVWI